MMFFGCSAIKSDITADSKMKIDQLLTPYEIADGPGFSMAVVKDGKIVYEKSVGFADPQNKLVTSKYTNYRLASVTKQFTAFGILQLNQMGRLSVDDPIQKYLPELPACARDIKIRHLLAHNSGLVDYEDLIVGKVPVLDKEVLKLLATQDTLQFAPGTNYHYSNSGYSLLALIIEKVSGESYPAYIRGHIFKPLGMDSSSFNVKGVRIPNRAYGYSKRESGYERTDQSTSSYVLGDGGIYSSVSDMVKWQNSLSTSKIIKGDPLKLVKSCSYYVDGQYTYASGWRIDQRKGVECFHHSGESIGFRNFHIYIPDKKIGLIFFSNRAGSTLNPGAVSAKIIDLFL